MSQWWLGALICLIGTATASLGITLQKKSHSRLGSSGVYLTNAAWQFGFVIYLSGQSLTMASMSLAPQSLIAVLGASSLIFNGLLSPLCLNESLGSAYIYACCMIILGGSLVAWSCPHNVQSYTLKQLLELLRHAPIQWFFATAGLCLAACLILRAYLSPSRSTLDSLTESDASRVHFARLKASSSTTSLQSAGEKANQRFFKYGSLDDFKQADSNMRGDSDKAEKYSDDDSEDSDDPAGLRTGVRLSHFNFMPTKRVEGGDLATSSDYINHAIDYSVNTQATTAQMAVLSLLAATIGALCASCSVLLAKCIAQLLKHAYLTGKLNAFESGKVTWLIVVVFIVTAVGSIHFLNVSLREAPAMYVYPYYYALSTTLTVASGFIYFQEYQDMTPAKLVAFFMGMSLAVCGAAFATSSDPDDIAPASPFMQASGEGYDSSELSPISCISDRPCGDSLPAWLCFPLQWIKNITVKAYRYLVPERAQDIPAISLSSVSHHGRIANEGNNGLPSADRMTSYVNPGLKQLPSLVAFLDEHPESQAYSK